LNTNGVARHYDALRIRERVALLTAAMARGDKREAQRLSDTAPMKLYEVPHHSHRMVAFTCLALSHRIELLDLAALLLRMAAMTDVADATGFPDQAERMNAAAEFIGFKFKVERDGWRLFCERIGAHPDAYAGCTAGADTLAAAGRLAEGWAHTAEEATAYVREKFDADLAPVPTAEGKAAEWHELWRTAFNAE
jgi:hypothetical protein